MKVVQNQIFRHLKILGKKTLNIPYAYRYHVNKDMEIYQCAYVVKAKNPIWSYCKKLGKKAPFACF